jgi:hypothetical protein
MRIMTTRFLVFALFACASCTWAASATQERQRLYSQANLLAIGAVTYYDTDPRAATLPDASLLETLSESRLALKRLAVTLPLPASVATPLAGMDASLSQLGRLSREQATGYAPLLISLLGNRAQFSQQMDAAFTEQPASPLAAALNRQSRRISEILLHALAGNAVVLREHSTAHYESGLGPQDQAIEQGFDELKALLPATAAKQFRQQRLAYRFVRPWLLRSDTLQKVASAQRYIIAIVAWLDQQAIQAEH